MPGIARKILVCAAVDGLVVHPLTSKRESYVSPSYKIKYGDASISQSSREALPDLTKPNSSFEAFGIVGKCCPRPLYLASESLTVCKVSSPFPPSAT
jgi:hypothetical protein